MERKRLESRRSEILHQPHSSSLSPPTEPSPNSDLTGILSEKNLLVAPNRAQLSLRKNGVSNGRANLQNSSRSLDGDPSFIKVNESNLGNLSSKRIPVRKMSKRVVMSPEAGTVWSSLRLQRPSLGRDPKHLQIVGALADSPDSLNPQHYISETYRSTSTRATVHQPEKSRSNTVTHQSVRTKNLSRSVGGQNSLRVGQNQKHSFVRPDKQMVQRRTSEWLESTNMDRSFAQQAQISQRQESGRPFSTQRFTPRQGARIMINQAQQSAQKPPEMTIRRAVDLLDKTNKEDQIYAAAYIQNQCLENHKARCEVHGEHGAVKLVQLLKSDNKEVQRVAAGALRNVVYKNGNNKKDAKEEDGLTIILNLLKSTHDKGTICQLAGLLWNLSADDKIRTLFDENVLHVLTEVILVPFSQKWRGRIQTNLSSDDNHRKNMRQCENLIDSLVFYTTETATKRIPDYESTENCVCILQNLTYEAEKDCSPKTTENTEETQQTTTSKETTCSCFPYRHANLRKDPKDKEKAEERCPLQNSEDPRGAEWLWSGQLVQVYLSLLTSSKNKILLEAAMGALQNLTVGKGKISEDVARIIQEQNGPKKIKTLLEEDKMLKKPALLLMRNLSRFPVLHSSIFDYLFSTKDTRTFLCYLDISAEESPELTPVLCRILVNLSKNNVKTASFLSHQMDMTDMLKKNHERKARQVVKELRNILQKSSDTRQKEEEAGEPTHEQGEHANSVQKDPGPGIEPRTSLLQGNSATVQPDRLSFKHNLTETEMENGASPLCPNSDMFLFKELRPHRDTSV